MINSPMFKFTLCLCFLTQSTLASGVIELLVNSPQTIIIESTVCVDFECPAADDVPTPRKVHGGNELRFQAGDYSGQALDQIDVHLKVIDPKSMKTLALHHFRPLTDAEWNPFVLQISENANVTVEMKNICNSNYYGKRCSQYCVASKGRHLECSPDGRRQCSAGWTGFDCSIPVCSRDCNGNGRCVAPDQCECSTGFDGQQCEKCIPTPGCVNGGCRNNIPMTCACKPGFVGDKCDIDVNICHKEKPCKNNGKCSFDKSSGFRCDCPSGFFGTRCEIPLSKVRCADNADHVCQNGGICISIYEKDIQCKCQPGFTGRFCEIGRHRDCSTMKCSIGESCQMIGLMPTCVGTTTTERPHVVIVNNHNYYNGVPEKKEDKNDQNSSQWIVICLFIVIIAGLLVGCVVIYTKIIKPSLQRSAACSPLPTTMPLSHTKSAPEYKVCIIEAKTANINGECCSHSPPPAYSSPVIPRLYKSIPTHDEHSFRP